VLRYSIYNVHGHLWPEIFQYLPVQDALHLNRAARFLHAATSTEDAWKKLYQSHFGPLVFNTEVRLQYIAAWLYRHAEECPRRDIAQIRFIKLLNFLEKYKAKTWVAFYLGMTNFHGKGVKVNKTEGKKYLLTATINNDYRAACELVIQMRKGLKVSFTPEGLQQLHTCLGYAWQQHGYAQTALALSFLHETGLGTAINLEEATAWLFHAMAKDEPEAVKQYARMISVAGNDTKETRLRELLVTYQNQNKVVAEVHYQLGLFYRSANRYVEDTAHFNLAHHMNHFDASYELSISANNMSSLLLPGFQQNHAKCTDKLYNIVTLGIISTPHKEFYQNILHEIKNSIKSGNVTAAILIANEIDLSKEKNNAEKVWLVQLAAQAGDAKSLQKLKNSHCHAPTAYVAIALAIIYQYGILNSAIVAAYSALVKQYFTEAEKLEPGSIEKYLQAGEKLGIICDDVRKLLSPDEPQPKRQACSKR